jgi:lipoyl(octanoyl) transferase
VTPWRWLGRQPYGQVLERQRAHREAILAGEAEEVIWLLEHDPVITVGRRSAPGTPSPEDLAALGVDFFAVERGGLATWHGPGQLVAYVLVDAAARRIGVKGLVCAVERGVIRWLAEAGVEAGRRTGYPGVWVSGMIPQKICAVGMHFRRGVSMHGIALNLSPDMAGFSLITPCGITNGGVTSLATLRGTAPTPEQAAAGLGAALAEAIADQEKKSS